MGSVKVAKRPKRCRTELEALSGARSLSQPSSRRARSSRRCGGPPLMRVRRRSWSCRGPLRRNDQQSADSFAKKLIGNVDDVVQG
jgi:hypothetical protein